MASVLEPDSGFSIVTEERPILVSADLNMNKSIEFFCSGGVCMYVCMCLCVCMQGGQRSILVIVLQLSYTLLLAKEGQRSSCLYLPCTRITSDSHYSVALVLNMSSGARTHVLVHTRHTLCLQATCLTQVMTALL